MPRQKECAVCEEKQKEINRILNAYKKDKKFYRYVILFLFITNIMTLAFGSDGVKMLFDLFSSKI